MHRKWIELLILLPLAIAAMWDGGNIAVLNRGRLGALESGGYVAFLGLVLVCLVAVYWFQAGPRGNGLDNEWESARGMRQVSIAVALLAGYLFLTGQLGYLLSTALFLIVYFRVFGSYRWTPVLISSFAMAVASAFLWSGIGLMLPQGVLPWP